MKLINVGGLNELEDFEFFNLLFWKMAVKFNGEICSSNEFITFIKTELAIINDTL